MGFCIQITVNEKLYLKNPQETKLGKKIIEHSILMIDKMGIECFNFKKLAEEIQCTEASVYRYFENKNYLLMYLVTWYWEWIKFQIEFRTTNMPDPRAKLRVIIAILVESSLANEIIEYVDESALHRIVITESAKTYRTKKVQDHNEEGFYFHYKSLCRKISDIILEINPKYCYPRALAGNLVETALLQVFYARNLPSLSDVSSGKDVLCQVKTFLYHIAFSLLDEKAVFQNTVNCSTNGRNNK